MARRRYSREYDTYPASYRSRSGRYRRERRQEERTVEMVSFGAIIVLFVITLLYPIPAATISLIGGGVLVGAAVYQWQRRWRVNPITWIGGAVMLFAGLWGIQGGRGVPGNMFLPMGIFALVIIASFLTGEF
jgi:intracellular septation protein A